METAQTKVCRMCNRELPASEFYISKTTADGLEARCKQCKKASERIRYAEKKKKQDTPTAVILASDQRFRKPINELKPADIFAYLRLLGYTGTLKYVKTIEI